MSFFFDHCCFKFPPRFVCRTTEDEEKHFQLNVDRSKPNEQIEENSKTNEFVNSSFYSSINSSSIDPQISTNEILIKNIILTRSSPLERLGLTLCYGLTSNLTTNVYIQQIDENSLASRQGEFRPGDQIIEINCEPVVSRDQAIDIVRKSSRIHFRIIRLENSTKVSLENDSGVIIHSPTTDLDTTFQPKHSFKKSDRNLSSSLSCLNCTIDPFEFPLNLRHCSSLNDLRISSFDDRSIVDNDQAFLKPLPFQSNSRGISSLNNGNRLKNLRRRYREQRLKEQYQMLITTDEETMSEFKQGKYWSRQQRKEHLIKSKQNRQRRKRQSNPFDFVRSSPTDDFHLLNRIFLRENQKEFKEKPYLATKFYYESLIEKEHLKTFLQKNHFQHRTSKTLFI